MRVLVVGWGDTPETFLQRLFAGLAERGIEVMIGVDRLGSRRAVRRPLAPAWVPARARGKRAAVERATWAVTHGRRPDRLAAVQRLAPDVIYFPWNTGAIDDPRLLDLGIPTVISCRGSQVLVAPWDPSHTDIGDGLRRTFAKATAVHCVSEHTAAAAESFGLDRSKATVIRPAVDPDVFSPGPAPAFDGRLELVTTGSVIWRKGLEYALVALAQLRAGGCDACLRVIGDGPDRQRALYTADDLGVADQVRLVGQQTPEQVVETLRAAHVFWLSSLEEGISNAVLEAMACGLPIVTTDAGGMREAVADGVEGFIVARRDPSAMAERTARLADASLRRRMGAAARARVLGDFQLRDQAEAFAALLLSAASTSAAR